MATDTVSADVDAVKLTADAAGVVWTLDGDGVPKCTKKHWDEFLTLQDGKSVRALRVPGFASNAPLLLGLQVQLKKGLHSSLEVCSPIACAAPGEGADVQLYKARACALRRSVGGWHPFNDLDGLAYGLSMYASGGLPWEDDKVAMLLEPHPLYRSLTFISGMDWRSLGFLVGTILDPRFYVDPAEPDAPPVRLAQFLGVEVKTQAEHPSSTVRGARYGAVLKCWQGGGEPKPDNLSPGHFLWRTYFAKGGGQKGVLAASRRMVDFLRQTWTAALCTSGQGPRLFVPKYFFSEDEEIDAYEKHLAKQDLPGK